MIVRMATANEDQVPISEIVRTSQDALGIYTFTRQGERYPFYICADSTEHLFQEQSRVYRDLTLAWSEGKRTFVSAKMLVEEARQNESKLRARIRKIKEELPLYVPKEDDREPHRASKVNLYERYMQELDTLRSNLLIEILNPEDPDLIP